MTALALAIVLSLVLVAHFLFGPGAAWTAGGVSFGAFALLWYALPIERRHQQSPSRSGAPQRLTTVRSAEKPALRARARMRTMER